MGISATALSAPASVDDVTLVKTAGIISVKTGNGANQAVILDGSGKMPAVDGSQLTNLNTGNGNIFLSSIDYNAIVQGTWAVNAMGANGWNGGITLFNSSNALNDEMGFKANMAAGTYTFKSIMHKATGRGIAELFIDGVSKGTFDCYNGTTLLNQLWTITGITISTSGIKSVNIKITGKNGASAGYWVDLTQLELYRTA